MNQSSVNEYPPVEGLPTNVRTHECHHVYVDSGRANELFLAMCKSLGNSIERRWRDTLDV